MEFVSILLAFTASLWLLRRDPGIGLFCLAAILIPALSGSFQSNIRYMGVIPAVYLFLGAQGRHPVFDRLWTLLSILLLGMQTFLYTFDMWVA